LTFDEMRELYRVTLRGRGTIPEAEMRVAYDRGARFNPVTRQMNEPGGPVYATPDDVVSVKQMPQAAQRPLRDAEAARALAEKKLTDLRKSTAAKPEQIKHAKQDLVNASCRLGEAGGDAYVKTRYPGPPPPELLWPVGDAAGGSRPGDFDRVYKVADKYGRTRIVIEAKGAGAGLNSRIAEPKGRKALQGTGKYLDSVIEEMADSKNPEERRVGGELAAMRMQIDYIEVRTPAGSPAIVHARVFDTTVDTGTRK
jgi:hypothetical protein